MKEGKIGQPINVDNCFKKKREFSLALKIENWNGILEIKILQKGM